MFLFVITILLCSCLFLFGRVVLMYFFFFFNDTATTEIYTLSLHDALPILRNRFAGKRMFWPPKLGNGFGHGLSGDRKSTRLNSSHLVISYAVFCLKKKKKDRRR